MKYYIQTLDGKWWQEPGKGVTGDVLQAKVFDESEIPPTLDYMACKAVPVKDVVEPTELSPLVKQTNPKDAIGTKKLAFSVLPWRVLCGVALGMMEGAAKYGRHNYRSAGVRASVYFDAVVARHMTQWWEGEDIDSDSGLHHIDKAIAGLMVMRDSMLQGNFVDDRPPRGNVDIVEQNRLAGEILDRHADKKPRHFTIGD